MGVINEPNVISCMSTDQDVTETKTKQKLLEIQQILNTPKETIDKKLDDTIRLPGLSEILPGLYLCGAGLAIPIFLEKFGITCVINAAPELPDTPLPETSRPIYMQIPVLDKSDINLSVYFDEVSDLIHQVRETNGKCMVHCVAGVSRSASLCLAYLMKYIKMTLREAFDLVRSARPQIRPNTGFFRQLIAYEESLFDGMATVKMVFKESLAVEIPDVYETEYEAMELFYKKYQHLRLR